MVLQPDTDMLETIRWCCAGMQALHENFGLRGFGGLFRRDLGINRFLLQFRALDDGQLLGGLPPSDVPVSLAGETGMWFCPWCGSELEKFYRDQLEMFPKHESLLPSGESEGAG
jgi:hypothetical protein